jgi:bacterioferritin-associated ferredoxin
MSIACSCEAVRDSEVMAAIEAGAHTVEEITLACGAGDDCMTCVPTLIDLLELAGYSPAATGVRNPVVVDATEP